MWKSNKGKREKGELVGTMSDEQGAPKTARLARIAERFEDADVISSTEVPIWNRDSKVLVVHPGLYTPIVDEFIETAYEDDWVRRDFDWTEWVDTPEAQHLLNDPEAVRRASKQQVAYLLTVILRQDRFADGAILGAIESGYLQRLLQRIRTLDDGAGNDSE